MVFGLQFTKHCRSTFSESRGYGILNIIHAIDIAQNVRLAFKGYIFFSLVHLQVINLEQAKVVEYLKFKKVR